MQSILNDILWLFLLPLSWIYGILSHFFILRKKSKKLSIPVISVGNLDSGGTGKTPLVIELARELEKYRPAIVSRGYRGKLSRQGALCDPRSAEGPLFYGDEPWMMSQQTRAQVYVGARRLHTIANFGIESNHGVVILDDGFQHRQIFRDADILLIPGETDPWSTACIPLGRLREPLVAARRASCVVITCSSAKEKNVSQWLSFLSRLAPQLPVFVAERTVYLERASKGTFGAFCGIAHPERLESDLAQLGQVKLFKAFSDHHRYRKEDVMSLIGVAKELGLTELITTQKDYGKVSRWFEDFSFPLGLAVVRYQFPKEFIQLIESKVA